MIQIDGSQGEGGGQVLRTSLALALVTGKPFSIRKIRANRKRPGLLRQHLTAVLAAAKVGQAAVEGAALGSTRIAFTPGQTHGGEYDFDVGSAGSATLVLQTILPALILAGEPSQLTLTGGTHNPFAPPFDFIEKTFLPLVRRMGPEVTITLGQHGFFPAGGGRISVLIEPVPKLLPIDLVRRGRIVGQKALAIVSRLPLHIAQREVDCIRRRLSLSIDDTETRQVDSPGPGNVVTIEIQAEHVSELFSGFGRKGVPAETVAEGVAGEARRYRDSTAAAGQHLADQLLVPMALAGGGLFRTLAPSSHLMTNAQTLARFLDVHVAIDPVGQEVWEVSLRGPA
jgi:RNA 3'-terminal phosphate cyclase (ATP)